MALTNVESRPSAGHRGGARRRRQHARRHRARAADRGARLERRVDRAHGGLRGRRHQPRARTHLGDARRSRGRLGRRGARAAARGHGVRRRARRHGPGAGAAHPAARAVVGVGPAAHLDQPRRDQLRLRRRGSPRPDRRRRDRCGAAAHPHDARLGRRHGGACGRSRACSSPGPTSPPSPAASSSPAPADVSASSRSPARSCSCSPRAPGRTGRCPSRGTGSSRLRRTPWPTAWPRTSPPGRCARSRATPTPRPTGSRSSARGVAVREARVREAERDLARAARHRAQHARCAASRIDPDETDALRARCAHDLERAAPPARHSASSITGDTGVGARRARAGPHLARRRALARASTCAAASPPRPRCRHAVADAVAGACAEALVNVAKHSGTRAAMLSLTWDGAVLEVGVHDEGCGWSGELLPEHGVSRSILGRAIEAGLDRSSPPRPDRRHHRDAHLAAPVALRGAGRGRGRRRRPGRRPRARDRRRPRRQLAGRAAGLPLAGLLAEHRLGPAPSPRSRSSVSCWR